MVYSPVEIAGVEAKNQQTQPKGSQEFTVVFVIVKHYQLCSIFFLSIIFFRIFYYLLDSPLCIHCSLLHIIKQAVSLIILLYSGLDVYSSMRRTYTGRTNESDDDEDNVNNDVEAGDYRERIFVFCSSTFEAKTENIDFGMQLFAFILFYDQHLNWPGFCRSRTGVSLILRCRNKYSKQRHFPCFVRLLFLSVPHPTYIFSSYFTLLFHLFNFSGFFQTVVLPIFTPSFLDFDDFVTINYIKS